jgi:succinate-semialdehyde dehydrogenase/glutarate-semialdehyde dehydrogenase
MPPIPAIPSARKRAESSFGGTAYSGMGREGGIEGIAGYLDTKLAQVVF